MSYKDAELILTEFGFDACNCNPKTISMAEESAKLRAEIKTVHELLDTNGVGLAGEPLISRVSDTVTQLAAAEKALNHMTYAHDKATLTRDARDAAKDYAKYDLVKRRSLRGYSARYDAFLAGAAFGAARAQADMLEALRSTHGQLASAVWWAAWLQKRFGPEV